MFLSKKVYLCMLDNRRAIKRWPTAWKCIGKWIKAVEVVIQLVV